MGDSVCRVCLSVLNDGKSMRDLNKTHVVVISKVKSPRSITEFQLISLCNMIYEIITKTLANKLKTVLLCVISSSYKVD